MRVAVTLFATAIVLSAPVSRAFISSNVTNSNDLAAGQKICKPRVLKNFLKCAYVQKGDSATWPDLSPCESVLGDCRGWVYHGVNVDELVGRSYLSAAGVSRKANFLGYYAYGDEDPKKCKLSSLRPHQFTNFPQFSVVLKVLTNCLFQTRHSI